VQHAAAEFHGVEQAFAAFAHQRVVAEDFDAAGLQFDQLAENVGRPVEQRAGQHGALDALAGGVGFALVALAGFAQAGAGNVQAMLGMVEQAPRQRFDQFLLGFQGVLGNRIGLDPVAVVEHAFQAVDYAPCAFGQVFVCLERRSQYLGSVHGCVAMMRVSRPMVSGRSPIVMLRSWCGARCGKLYSDI